MSELREEVLGDGGYEVSRFAEKNCEKCVGGFNCVICDGKNKYQPKPSPVLGETVLNYDQICATGAFINTSRQDAKTIATIQDSHTRKCLKEQGWKSPEEVERILRDWQDKAFREVALVRNTVELNTRREVAETLKTIAHVLENEDSEDEGDYDYAILKSDYEKLLADLEG